MHAQRCERMQSLTCCTWQMQHQSSKHMQAHAASCVLLEPLCACLCKQLTCG